MAVLVAGLSSADPYVGVDGQISINDKLYRSTSTCPTTTHRNQLASTIFNVCFPSLQNPVQNGDGYPQLGPRTLCMTVSIQIAS